MGSLPVVLLLCSFHVLTAVVQAQESGNAPLLLSHTSEHDELDPWTNSKHLAIHYISLSVSSDCREEMYPCTRMYSVHRPIKRCIGHLCFYSLPRVYVINKEICMRTVCQQDEYLKGEADHTC
ncbi:hypothetical protein INR49_032055 [Caranx melampygus]|nr:hypothetical protein INR49_032055 [Caranx melampygus]